MKRTVLALALLLSVPAYAMDESFEDLSTSGDELPSTPLGKASKKEKEATLSLLKIESGESLLAQVNKGWDDKKTRLDISGSTFTPKELGVILTKIGPTLKALVIGGDSGMTGEHVNVIIAARLPNLKDLDVSGGSYGGKTYEDLLKLVSDRKKITRICLPGSEKNGLSITERFDEAVRGARRTSCLVVFPSKKRMV